MIMICECRETAWRVGELPKSEKKYDDAHHQEYSFQKYDNDQKYNDDNDW